MCPMHFFRSPRCAALGVLGTLALASAACSTLPTAAPATLPALSEAPARTGDYQWFYDRDDNEHQLFYGLANTDDIPFGLTCNHGSGQIRLTTPGEDRSINAISLTSAGQVGTYRARASSSEVFDGFDIIADTTPTDPVMQAFALSGWLAIAEKGQWVGLVGDSSSPQLASRFISGCKH